MQQTKPQQSAVLLTSVPGGRRVELFANEGLAQLGYLVVSAMQATLTVRRALVLLDFDVYGARRGDRHWTTFCRPISPGAGVDPGAILDGVTARLSLARLYGVPMESLSEGAAKGLAGWRAALGLP